MNGGERLDERLPTELALLALTQHQLGRREEAQESLTHLRRRIIEQPLAADDAGVRSLISEAEALVNGRGG